MYFWISEMRAAMGPSLGGREGSRMRALGPFLRSASGKARALARDFPDYRGCDVVYQTYEPCALCKSAPGGRAQHVTSQGSSRLPGSS